VAAEVVPERNAQFRAGLGEPESGVATVAPDIAACASADLSFGDLAADVPLGIVSMSRDVGTGERRQQLGPVGVQPPPQAIQRNETGASLCCMVSACCCSPGHALV